MEWNCKKTVFIILNTGDCSAGYGYDARWKFITQICQPQTLALNEVSSSLSLALFVKPQNPINCLGLQETTKE